MKRLYLEDLKGYSEEQIKEHLIEEYEADKEQVDRFNILVAYESVGSWGCDSSSYFLLQDKETNKYYEVHGSHCSCCGFEEQFEPEETTITYLKSGNFGFSTGGYDYNSNKNEAKVKDYMKHLKLSC